MRCPVCYTPHPGPHKMSCRPSEREAARLREDVRAREALRAATTPGVQPEPVSLPPRRMTDAEAMNLIDRREIQEEMWRARASEEAKGATIKAMADALEDIRKDGVLMPNRLWANLSAALELAGRLPPK